MNRWSCLTVLVLSATLYFVFVMLSWMFGFPQPTLFEMMGRSNEHVGLLQ